MQRLAFLDSLRGLAAVYVVFYHMTLLPDPHLMVPHWASMIVLNGGTAVTLFFIVSAFSLCYAMQRHAHETIYDFYVRRFFRIAPLFYTCIIFYIIRDYFYYHALHTPLEIAASVFFVFNFFPGHETGFVWASWTIGVEMVFYLIFPFLFQRLKTIPALTAAFFAALLGAVIFNELLMHTSFPTSVQEGYFSFCLPRVLPIFLFGMLAYRIYEEMIAVRPFPPALGYALIFASLYGYYALLHGALNIGFADSYYWQAIIYAALLLGLAIRPSIIFVNRVTAYLGKISYSIYLLHPSIVLFLFPVYKRIYALPMPVSAQFLLSAVLTLGTVLLLASLSYQYIERPGMNLGKKALQWLPKIARTRSPTSIISTSAKD